MHKFGGIIHLFTQPSPPHAFEALGLLVVTAVGLWCVKRATVTLIVSVGFAAEVFSGNWKYIPIPIPLDRALLGLGLLLLFLRGAKACGERQIRFQAIHFLLFAVVAYTLASALLAGTLTTSIGFFSLLDRLGVLPFLFYALAPVLFGGERQRDILLTTMVVLGCYLGIVGFAEGVGVHALVLPHYINNQAIGITQGRARGPFLASDANGLVLFDCAVFSCIALTRWRRTLARRVCYLVIGLAAIDIFFTLTRADWIGAALGALAVAISQPRLRRLLPVALVVVTAFIVGALEFVPGLKSKTVGRVNTASSVWDRYNTNKAAVRIVENHPLFGIGWQTFDVKSVPYLREAGTYPLTGVGLEVHNVFLSHFAELGLVGGLLWILALLSGVGGSVVRRGPPELYPWRLGLAAVFIMFLVVANLGPLSYALPNLLLWMLAGIVATERNSVPRSEPRLLGDEVDDRGSVFDGRQGRSPLPLVGV